MLYWGNIERWCCSSGGTLRRLYCCIGGTLRDCVVQVGEHCGDCIVVLGEHSLQEPCRLLFFCALPRLTDIVQCETLKRLYCSIGGTLRDGVVLVGKH